MTGWERLNALPEPQRGFAHRLLFRKLLRRFSEMSDVTEANMTHHYGFNRADLVRWFNEGYREVQRKQ